MGVAPLMTEPPDSSLTLSAAWGNSEKTATWERGRGPHQTPPLPAPWSWSCRPLNCGNQFSTVQWPLVCYCYNSPDGLRNPLHLEWTWASYFSSLNLNSLLKFKQGNSDKAPGTRSALLQCSVSVSDYYYYWSQEAENVTCPPRFSWKSMI